MVCFNGKWKEKISQVHISQNWKKNAEFNRLVEM